MKYYNYLITYTNGEKTAIDHCENRMNFDEMDSFIVIDCQNIGKRMKINLEHVLYIEETETAESE
jgi:triosephosphate isomerase